MQVCGMRVSGRPGMAGVSRRGLPMLPPVINEGLSGATILDLTDPRWGYFVAGHPEATPFHHPGWARLIASCYGFRAFAVAASDATGAIRAGLPVVEVRHLHGRPQWESLPYTDYCPPLVSAIDEQEQLAAVLRQAGCAAGARRIEVRAPLPDGAVPARPALRHVIT